MGWGTNSYIRSPRAATNPLPQSTIASSMMRNGVTVGADGGLSSTLGHMQPQIGGAPRPVIPPSNVPPAPGDLSRTSAPTMTPGAPATTGPAPGTTEWMQAEQAAGRNPFSGATYQTPPPVDPTADAARMANLAGQAGGAAGNTGNYFQGGQVDLNSGLWGGKTPSQLIQMYAQMGSNDPRKWQLHNALSAKYGDEFASGRMVNKYSAGGTDYNPNDMQMAYQMFNGAGASGGGPGAVGPGQGAGAPPVGPSPQFHGNMANWWDQYNGSAAMPPMPLPPTTVAAPVGGNQASGRNFQPPTPVAKPPPVTNPFAQLYGQ